MVPSRCYGRRFSLIACHGMISACRWKVCSPLNVHHIVPLGQIKGEYEVDPIRDLTPVCANCHATIHSTRPALDSRAAHG